METYIQNTVFFGFVGIFISFISGIVFIICKRTRKYAWIFGCIAGFCFFTALHHLNVDLAHDDITDPGYEVYKNWTIYHLILSDIILFFIWLGIGILNYLAFVKGNKLVKYLFILVASVFLIAWVLLLMLSLVTSI